MKKILPVLICALTLAGCHSPEYVPANVDRQAITSLTAIITSGKYVDQPIAKLDITPEIYEKGVFVLEIPYYFPETSTESSTKYLTALRIQAELQPNCTITPALGRLDMVESHDFVLTDAKGESHPITIMAKRVKSKACDLLSFMVDDFMVEGVIYENTSKILIPYMDDLSSVSISGQVSPNARISKVSGVNYVEGNKYNLNTGATVTVLAANEKDSKTYTVEQGIPELLESGLNINSVKNLFNVDPVTMVGLPAYTEKAYVSLAGLGSNLIVSVGGGKTPVYLNSFTGVKLGEINLGSAVADAITNDDCGNMLIVNYAENGETVNIYRTSSVTEAPSLLCSFANPSSFPVGHRIKALGDVNGTALIALTAEGIDGLSAASNAVFLTIMGGALESVVDKTFGPIIGLSGWGSAPVHHGTIIPASLDPMHDGYFLDYYEGNSETYEGQDLYILHYINGRNEDVHIAHIGDWAQNPNCLDIKTFNHARYMSLFVVSHFPCWGYGPRLYLYDVTDPTSASLMLSNEEIPWYQTGAYDGEAGASGDVVICPTTDGYRTYIYYYDHHSQAIGAYVADCFKL